MSETERRKGLHVTILSQGSGGEIYVPVLAFILLKAFPDFNNAGRALSKSIKAASWWALLSVDWRTGVVGK